MGLTIIDSVGWQGGYNFFPVMKTIYHELL